MALRAHCRACGIDTVVRPTRMDSEGLACAAAAAGAAAGRWADHRARRTRHAGTNAGTARCAHCASRCLSTHPAALARVGHPGLIARIAAQRAGLEQRRGTDAGPTTAAFRADREMATAAGGRVQRSHAGCRARCWLHPSHACRRPTAKAACRCCGSDRDTTATLLNCELQHSLRLSAAARHAVADDRGARAGCDRPRMSE